MADQKISELTEFTSLTDDDVFPANDGSTTKKITWANIKTAIQSFIEGLASYFNVSTDTLDDISDGSTYKKLTATKEAYIDQDVTNGSSPTFDAANITGLTSAAVNAVTKRIVSILVFGDADDVAVGDGAGDVFFRVPAEMNSWNLIDVAACVQTAGTTNTTDIQIHNITQAVDMLTTKITIDSGEKDSSTAATPAVIDTTNDDVATGDQIRIDVDQVSTTPPKGLLVELTFQKP